MRSFIPLFGFKPWSIVMDAFYAVFRGVLHDMKYRGYRP